MTSILYNKSLSELLVGMLADPSVLVDLNVTGLSLDSRQVLAGGLFFSLAKDIDQRVHNLKQALSLGVAVVLFDKEQIATEEENKLLTQANTHAYSVRNLGDKTGEIAARFYGHPSLAFTVIAVTGTNGKTSVSQFIAQALESLNKPCGVIGTLGVGSKDKLKNTGMTTPDPVTLQAVLAELCQQGIKYVVIEASSHALAQGRLNSVSIDVAVLTNLSRDHLDYHHDMTEYAAVKSQLFDFPSVKIAVLNSVDELGQKLIAKMSDSDDVKLLTYSSQAEISALFEINNKHVAINGLSFNLTTQHAYTKISSPLLGAFNIDNLLAAFASLIAINVSFDDASQAINQCHSVDGRMQNYGSENQLNVVVDFAHTPEALTQALQSLRTYMPEDGKLWCVFGCGGDRDTGKRALMGYSADRYADYVVLTDDNPRSENNAVIIEDILTGISEQEKVHIEHDRKLAITYAITHAKATDIILVAGKGHEQYQDVMGVKQPFSDAEIVVTALKNAKNDMLIYAGVTS